MAVSPGNLDSLLNTSYPVADFTGVSIQSETGATSALSLSNNTYSTVTVKTTGTPGPGASAGDTVTIVGVDDADNAITYSLAASNGEQLTGFVVGYSSSGILVSLSDPGIFALTLSGAFQPASSEDDVTGVLSSTPIPAQTTITFSSSGSSPTTPPAPPPTPTPPPTGVTLDGSSSQYIVIDTNGSLYIQDTVSGRDGTQTLSGVTTMHFSDGTGVFDPTGTAEDVARLYGAAFGRAPDTAGLEYWTAQIDDSHVPLVNVANSFATSPEFIQDFGSLSDPAFVGQLYQSVLGRPADAAGAQYWDGVLASGTSRGAVLADFAESQEYEADTISTAGDPNNAEVYRLYVAAFNRVPDAGGQAYWSASLASGTTPTQMAQSIVGSAEFMQDFGGLSVNDFVSKLYENVLHRAADAGGAAYWTSALLQGTSEASALVAFADSSENLAQTAGATHANWVFIAS